MTSVGIDPGTHLACEVYLALIEELVYYFHKEEPHGDGAISNPATHVIFTLSNVSSLKAGECNKTVVLPKQC